MTHPLAMLAVSVVVAAGAGQKTSDVRELDPVPGAMKLLPGYRHTKDPGDVQLTGNIWKERGLDIYYDIGGGGSTTATRKAKALWYKEQVVNGRVVQLALAVFPSKSRELFVSVPEGSDRFANFHAKVQSEEDVAEMLLMVLTYTPAGKPK